MPPKTAPAAETSDQNIFQTTLQSLQKARENHDIDAAIEAAQGFFEILDTEGKVKTCKIELGREAAKVFRTISQFDQLPLTFYGNTLRNCFYMFNPDMVLPDSCHLKVIPNLGLEDRKNLTIGILSSTLQIISAPIMHNAAEEERLNGTWLFILGRSIPYIVESARLGAFKRRKDEGIF